MESDLWRALGRPPLGRLLPHPASWEWKGARASLRQQLRTAQINARVTTPAGLWARLYGQRPPPGATWGALIRQSNLTDLETGLNAGGDRFRVASWNLRWLVDPGSQQGRGKKMALLRKLRGAAVVCVQETHWREADAGVWAGLFPGAAVAASPARAGPHGGPQGGVAIFVPTPHVLLRTVEIVPGCGVAAWIRTDEHREVIVVSMYLPPGDRAQVLRLLRANMPQTCGLPVFLAGDVNFQLDDPRSGVESELAGSLGVADGPRPPPTDRLPHAQQRRPI